MKFTISTQELNYLLGKIEKVISPKPTIPILSNFLLEAYNDELILTASDLAVSIKCYTETKILEEGATTLPAKRFAQLIRELTSTDLEVTSNEHDITTITSNASRFKINGMNKSSFPIPPDLLNDHSFVIKQKVLKDLLFQTSFTVSKDDSRYALTGLQMQINDSKVTFLGSDGKRLAKAWAPIEIPSSFKSQVIIPLKAVEEIQKNLLEEGEAKISLSEDKIAVETNRTCLVAKLLAAEYPDLYRVIPENTSILISLHCEEMITLLRQISIFIPDQNPVRVTFEEGELKLSANSKEIGEGYVSTPVNYYGPKLEMAFSPNVLKDFLHHCKEETATLGLTDSYNPGIITDGNQEGLLKQASPLFLIMPMRLPEE